MQKGWVGVFCGCLLVIRITAGWVDAQKSGDTFAFFLWRGSVLYLCKLRGKWNGWGSRLQLVWDIRRSVPPVPVGGLLSEHGFAARAVRVPGTPPPQCWTQRRRNDTDDSAQRIE